MRPWLGLLEEMETAMIESSSSDGGTATENGSLEGGCSRTHALRWGVQLVCYFGAVVYSGHTLHIRGLADLTHSCNDRDVM